MEFLVSIKLYHWKTLSYSRHIASDNLQIGLNPLLDQFVESYQGDKGRVDLNKGSMTVYNIDDKNATFYVSKLVDFMTNNFEQYLQSKGVKNTSHLLNIRDEMVTLLNKTLYLFTLN